jgi:predicted amidohydrolase YtcJ/peptidoglycan hydrolase-like protein with peptidoglycan-binding domain
MRSSLWTAGAILTAGLACSFPEAAQPQAGPEAAPPPGVSAPTAPRPPTAEPATPAEIVFYNGNLLTMEGPAAQAIAVAGDRILAVGTNDEILALATAGTSRIDLQGRTLTPGFIDSHSHRIPQRYKWGFDGADEAFHNALRQGWTGLTELALNEDEWGQLHSHAVAGQLPIRVDGYLLFNTFEGDPLPEWYNAYQPGQPFGPFLRAAGLKFFIDFNSGRVLFFDPAGLAEQLRLRRAEGWQIAMKAIGVQSHQLALDAIELAEGGEDAGAARYRIEHALAQTPEQQQRMARMGVIGSIQPGLVGAVASWPDIQALIVEEGAATISNWRGMFDAGVHMAASPLNPDGISDEYTNDSHTSPMGVLYRGTTQIGLAGRAPEPWMVEHALTVDEILPLLTIDAAYAIFQEDTRGSLAPGKLADLVILSADPRAVPLGGLPEIETLMTMVGGQIAWCAPGAESVCPGTAASPPTPVPTTAPGTDWPVLQVGSQGPEVAALQYLLRHHGQDIPADGQFGPVTQQAVKNFQSQNGLVADGMVGGQTWPALVQGVVLQVGSRGDAARAAQVLLLEKFGYEQIVVDGLYGRVTEAAVKAFQSDHGLIADGMVGATQTWPALISIQP